MTEIEEKFKALEKHSPFIKKATADSVTYITDREKRTLKGIQKIIHCRKATALDKLDKCEKFIVRCISKERAALQAATAPRVKSTTASDPPQSAEVSPPTSKSSTVATVVILSSDDEDCAIVDDKANKETSPAAFKSPTPPSSSKPNGQAIPSNITNMEILSLIDTLRQKDTPAPASKEKKQDPPQKVENPAPPDTGISLISSDESDSWSKDHDDQYEEDEEKAKRKAKKLKKKEQRRREKLEVLKKQLNSKEKNIVELKKKLGYNSDSSLSSVDSITPKEKSKVDDSQRKSEEEKTNNVYNEKENPVADVQKPPPPAKPIVAPEPQPEPSSSTNLKEIPAPKAATSTNYTSVPLIIKAEIVSEVTSIFSRRPKKEPVEEAKKEVPPLVSNPSVPDSSDLYSKLRNLLKTELGVDMETFLDIMKTDKFEIKKEIISKVLNAEEPPPAPRFQKPMEEEPPPPPPIKRRDPRVPQEINVNLNLNMPPNALYNDPMKHTLNLNISTSSGMQLNSAGKGYQYNHNNIPIPPLPAPRIPSPPLRDPRLRRAQPPNNILPSPVVSPMINHSPIIGSPIMNSPDYSPREHIPKPNFPVQNQAAANDKRSALTYAEYRKRKALEEQKKMELQKLLNEVESKNAEAQRQLKEREQLLEPAVPPAKTIFVGKPVAKPVIEYVKPSDESDPADDEKEDDEEDDMDEETKMNTLRNRELKNSQILNIDKATVSKADVDPVKKNDSGKEKLEKSKPKIDIVKEKPEKSKIEELKKSKASNVKVPTPKSSPQTSEKDDSKENSSKHDESSCSKSSKSPLKASSKDKDLESEKLVKNYKKNFREVIALNMDIMQSFMPNSVLQDHYGLHRSRNALNEEVDEVDNRRIMTRRKSYCNVQKEDVSPERIKKRRKSSYIAKKETKTEKKEPKKRGPKKKEDKIEVKNDKVKEKEDDQEEADWQVEAKLKSPPATGAEPKINLILRKRASSCFSDIFSTSEVARPGFLKQLKKPVEVQVKKPVAAQIPVAVESLQEKPAEPVLEQSKPRENSPPPPPPRGIIPANSKKLVIKLQRLTNEEILKYKRKSSESLPNTAKKSKPTPAEPEPEKIAKNTDLNHTFQNLFDKEYKCKICCEKAENPVGHYVTDHCTECYASRLLFDEIINFSTAELEPKIEKGKKRIDYECFVCKLTITSTIVGVIYHISSHTGEFSFRCDICDLEKPYKKDIQKHVEEKKILAKKKRGAKKRIEGIDCKDAKPIHYYRYSDEATELNCYYCKLCYFFQINKANVEKHVKDQHDKVYNKEDFVDEIQVLKFKEAQEDEGGNDNMDIDETCSTTVSVCSERAPPSEISIPEPVALEPVPKEIEKKIKIDEFPEVVIKTEVIDIDRPETQPVEETVPIMPQKQIKTEEKEEKSDAPDKDNYLVPRNTIINSRIVRVFALYKCMDSGCNFATNLPDEFIKHIESKQKPDRYYCCYCVKSVPGKGYAKVLSDHIRNMHGVCRYQCNECFYRSFNLSNILVHKRSTHALKGNLDVIDCLNALPDETIKLLHTKDKKNMQQMCKCPVCPPPLMKVSTEDMEKHVLQSHPLVSREKMFNNFYCIFCKFACLEKYSMKEHMSTEHPVNFLKAAKIVNSSNKKDSNKKLFGTIQIISLDDELKSFPNKSLVVWQANREDLNITSEGYKYLIQDTSKYNQMMQMIPRYIPKAEVLLCKFPNCSFNAKDMEGLLKHSMSYHGSATSLKCHFCPNINKLASAPILRDHYEKHSAKNIYTCGMCNTFSSCRKLLSDHARSAHINEDVVMIEMIRSELSTDTVNSYSISLRDERRTISTFTKCIFCDYELKGKSLEEHLIDYHFCKLRYSCWHCDNVVCANPYDLDNHFIAIHKGASKICLDLKLRFDIDDDDLLVKKEIPVRKQEPVVISVLQPVVAPAIELKTEVIEDDDFIDIVDDDDAEPPPPVPVKPHLKIVPLKQMMDPRFLN